MKRYIMFFCVFVILGIFVTSYGCSNKTLQCTYNNQMAYDCQRNLKVFGIDFGTQKFSNITKAVLTSKENRKGELNYQIQFVNKNGENVQGANTWNTYDIVNKDVTEINESFGKSKNFNYTFVQDRFAGLWGLFFIVFPFLLLFLIPRDTKDTGFKNFDAKKFLAKKDLSKMSDEELLAFIKQKNNTEK